MRPARLWSGVLAGIVLIPIPALASETTLVLDLGGMTLETVLVPRGVFAQGGDDPDRERDEEPVHEVTISHDFWMGKYPVTREQFAKFVADTRYVTDAERGPSGGAGWNGRTLVQKKNFSWRNPGFIQTDDHPVIMVTYNDAVAFAGWVSRKTGRNVRLPSEAEWEFAARAGTTTPWYSGDNEDDSLSIGWFNVNARGGTRPVGQKDPNGLGLYDMSGNVFEWCRDFYAPYSSSALIDPLVTVTKEPDLARRVLRGGSWLRSPKRARSSARFSNTATSRSADQGFRIVALNDDTVSSGALGLAPAPAKQAEVSPGAVFQRNLTAAPSSEAAPWSRLILWPLVASTAVVAWMLVRRRRGPRELLVRGAITTRAAHDGFFVSVEGALPGLRVRYECLVDGKEARDVVLLGGDETFVYVGALPQRIRVHLVDDTGVRGHVSPPNVAGAESADHEGTDEPTAPLAGPAVTSLPPSDQREATVGLPVQSQDNAVAGAKVPSTETATAGEETASFASNEIVGDSHANERVVALPGVGAPAATEELPPAASAPADWSSAAIPIAVASSAELPASDAPTARLPLVDDASSVAVAFGQGSSESALDDVSSTALPVAEASSSALMVFVDTSSSALPAAEASSESALDDVSSSALPVAEASSSAAIPVADSSSVAAAARDSRPSTATTKTQKKKSKKSRSKRARGKS